MPRVSVYISKTNVSHDLIYHSGVFGMHFLRADQWEVIWRLGLQSAQEVTDKLDGLGMRIGTTGCPLLVDVMAGMECQVVNAMDTGASTLFLGDVVSVESGREGAVMTSEHFRTHMPPDKQAIYEARLEAAQSKLDHLARTISSPDANGRDRRLRLDSVRWATCASAAPPTWTGCHLDYSERPGSHSLVPRRISTDVFRAYGRISTHADNAVEPHHVVVTFPNADQSR